MERASGFGALRFWVEFRRGFRAERSAAEAFTADTEVLEIAERLPFLRMVLGHDPAILQVYFGVSAFLIYQLTGSRTTTVKFGACRLEKVERARFRGLGVRV